MSTPLAVPDLLSRTASLVAVPSVSHHEAALADLVWAELSGRAPWLELERVGDNLVARSQLGRDQRIVLAGHLDTVPANHNSQARVTDGVCWGLGSTDMKGGLAVLMELALSQPTPAVDVTWVFYACEEVDQRFNGLRALADQRPDLLEGDAAVLCEPTGARVEAGCQGTLRLSVTLTGERAHTARAWMGVNAVHRLAPLLARVASYEGRRPVLDGCEYREALQAVRIEGGVANNVVPDQARVVINHRFAPDRSVAEAVAHVETVMGDSLDREVGDCVEVEDAAAPAPPGLQHPLLAGLLGATGHPARAKLGWTDVSFFAGRGTPAVNFGPGDPTLAHTAGEHVSRDELTAVYSALSQLISPG